MTKHLGRKYLIVIVILILVFLSLSQSVRSSSIHLKLLRD